MRLNRAPIDRATDRRVALFGILVALAFMAAALASLALPEATRKGLWLPLHLALAGGASSAIAGLVPFFVAAFAAARPADPALRLSGLIGIAGGAAGVTVGVVAAPGGWLAPVGGLAYVAGVALTGAATIRPLSGALGPSRGIVSQAYVGALLAVTIGATVATLDLAGWPPVVEAWTRLRPAHAWLNLIGFVSLITATTLLHFFPTVVGSRIAAHPSARLTVFGLGAGSIVVAAGYGLAVDVLVRVGAAIAVLGSLALARYAGRIWAARARWTTDPSWHLFAIGGLVSAMTWFVTGMAILGARAAVFGLAPSRWAVDVITGPLVVGWIGLAFLASATHLVPAVGPGGSATHARQRHILGIWAAMRLITANGGVAAISMGLPLGISGLATAGVVLVGLPFAATAIFLARAVWIGLRRSAIHSPRTPPADGED
jgi:nitrite reductase (NO-forming)